VNGVLDAVLKEHAALTGGNPSRNPNDETGNPNQWRSPNDEGL